MGIYDRDYYRESVPRSGFGHFVAWSVTTWLIVLNVVVFFVDGALHRLEPTSQEIALREEEGIPPPSQLEYSPLRTWGAFSVRDAVKRGQVWRFITFQFLHVSGWHIIANMIGLYMFGPIVEAHFSARRYLAFYLLCGVAGALCFILMEVTHILNIGPATELIGASAGIFGLLVAAAMIAPDVQIYYYFFPITIGMLAVGGMVVAAYTVLASAAGAGGESAHLGGGVLGFVLMKNQHWLNVFAGERRPAPRRPTKYIRKDWSKVPNR